MNSYLKGKCNLISRDYKEAISTFKNLDLSVIFEIEFYFSKFLFCLYNIFKFTHRSAEILSSLGTSQYLNGEYSNAISSFEKVFIFEITIKN